LDTDNENDSDDDNSCCKDSSDRDVSSGDDGDGNLDLNDLQIANTGSATNDKT